MGSSFARFRQLYQISFLFAANCVKSFCLTMFTLVTLTWRRLLLCHRMDGEGLEIFTIHSLLRIVFLFLTFKGWLGRNLVFGYHVGITN